jgi:hypothetical protein
VEEQLLNIGEVIKGFREQIQDLQLRRTLGTPLEVHEGMVRMAMTTISHINKVEDECEKLCKESVQVLKELMGDPKMKAIEAKLREVQYQVHEVAEKVETLPPVESMTTILAQ